MTDQRHILSRFERIIFDGETYWDVDYSVTKLTYLQYARDPRFQWMCGVLCRESNGFKPEFYRGQDLERKLASIDWKNVELIAHNMHFDGACLAHPHGEQPRIIPARYTCTLSYSRYHNKGITGHSLEALCEFYGISGKQGDLTKITKGKRREELDEATWAELETYTIGDGKRGTYVWLKLQPHVGEDERVIQDMTFRMAFEPMLKLDKTLIDEAVIEAQQKHNDAIGVYDISMLRSRPRFAKELERLGVEVPMKLNKKGDKWTYAFSKKDEDFIVLLDHPNEEIADLVEAKMASSSNIDLTRALRLQDMGEDLIVTLQPSGAKTDRWSGTGGTNLQNLRQKSKLRKAITAPDGYLLFAPDQSQIEVRINGAVSDHHAMLQDFKNGVDQYNKFGTNLYRNQLGGIPLDRKGNPAHDTMGFVSKTVVLGCGYQTGWKKLQAELATGKKRLVIDDNEAQRIIDVYRTENWPIVANWQRQDENMRRMCDHSAKPFTWKWMEFRPREHRVYWPDGSSMVYWDIQVDDEGKMIYWDTHSWRTIYGGKAVENQCQKTGNSIIKQNALDIWREMGVRMLNTVHDEMHFLLPISEAQAMAARILEIMKTPKDWFAGIPVDAEGELSRSYLK